MGETDKVFLQRQLRRLESEIGALRAASDPVMQALYNEQLGHLRRARLSTLAQLAELIEDPPDGNRKP